MAQQQDKKWTLEEIREAAPNYRGKPENFKPKGKRGQKPSPAGQDKGPSTSKIPPPKYANLPQTPTAQRNDSIISEAIFGVDVRITPIDERQSFDNNFSKLPKIAEEVFNQYPADERFLDRIIEGVEFEYYSTAMLWIRLLDIKQKQALTALTSQEKDILKAVADVTFNVPQPIYAYLSQIGNVTDKMGKETLLSIPNLPIADAGGFGGYHHAEINEATHNLFEEIPSLGMIGDSIMTLAHNDPAPNTTVRVALPARSQIVAENLLGYRSPLVARRDEIKRRLASQGITADRFQEFVLHTRFNLRYLESLSDIIGKLETFRIEKVVIRNLTLSGGESQVIMTKPLAGEELNQPWRDTIVAATSAACESTALTGAAYPFGFQLYKEPGEGATLTARSVRWSCLTSAQGVDDPWTVSDNWAGTRNTRRNLPAGIGTERFRSIAMNQSLCLRNIVRRMIKTSR